MIHHVLLHCRVSETQSFLIRGLSLSDGTLSDGQSHSVAAPDFTTCCNCTSLQSDHFTDHLVSAGGKIFMKHSLFNSDSYKSGRSRPPAWTTAAATSRCRLLLPFFTNAGVAFIFTDVQEVRSPPDPRCGSTRTSDWSLCACVFFKEKQVNVAEFWSLLGSAVNESNFCPESKWCIQCTLWDCNIKDIYLYSYTPCICHNNMKGPTGWDENICFYSLILTTDTGYKPVLLQFFFYRSTHSSGCG